MRQACVQFECISNIDNPFNNIETFIFKPFQKRQVLIVSIIAAWRDHATWWNFPSWYRGGASHDHNHDLIILPKMCLTWYSFLFEGKWKYIQKRISSFRHLNWLQKTSVLYHKLVNKHSNAGMSDPKKQYNRWNGNSRTAKIPLKPYH